MPAITEILLSAGVGAIVSVIGGALAAAIESRRKIDESLRERRSTDYLKLWKLTSVVPKWPRATLLLEDLNAFAGKLKDWYFSGGGMYLSSRSQRAYKHVQEAILDVAKAPSQQATVADTDYDLIQKACSGLRTALTSDLLSRSRSFWTGSLFSFLK